MCIRDRLCFVEVMGHTAGYLAMNSAIATGSEAAIIPEMLSLIHI